MPVTTAFIDPAEISGIDLLAWRDLARRAAEPNPFFEPETVIPAIRTLGERDVRLLVARDSDGWIGLVPIRRQTRWRLMPMPSLSVWRHPYCFLGTPLVAAERTRLGLGALIDQALNARVAFFALDTMCSDGPVGEALESCIAERNLSPVVYRRYERAALHRRAEPTYLDETRSAHHRRESNRLRRKLERDLSGAVHVDDRAGDPTAVEEFLRLEASGWKGTSGTGTAMASRPGHATFFRELCAGMAARGALQLVTLRIGERLVGMQCNLRGGNTLFCFKIAHDVSLGRYSPGIQVEIEVVNRFHAEPGLTLVDSCAAPENMMINRLWPDRRRISTVVVPRRGAAGAVARYQGRGAAALEARRRKAKA